MNEPVIKSLARGLSMEDRESLGDIEFSNYNYFLGVELKVENGEGSKSWLPENVGTFVPSIWDTDTGEFEILQLRLCKDILPETTIQNSRPEIQAAILGEGIACIDPQDGFLQRYEDGVGGGKK